jgi:glycosyltransferase involved in cell wall biosynthesis
MTIDKPLSIGFYCYSVFNRGGDRLTIAYANHLAAAGHDVTLHVTEMNTVFEVSPALKIHFVDCCNRAGFLWHALTHKLNHDVVIVNIIHLHLLLSLHNKVVYYAQADDVEYYDSRLMRTLIDVLYRVYFKSAQTMISMSQHLTDIFSQRYSAKNIITITTGIDHNTFYPDLDNELIRQKGEKKAVLLMARGDAYRKGFDLSLQILGSLNPATPARMELWVCGDQLVPDNYTFTVRNFGAVSDQRLREILSSTDIFFYPSRHEGFGLFPLEAMACGCVVVTTSAIPYAKESGVIKVSAVGDVLSMQEDLETVLNESDDNQLNMHLPMILEKARSSSNRPSYRFKNSQYEIIRKDHDHNGL